VYILFAGTADECHPRNGHRVASSSNGLNNVGRQVCVCVERNPSRPHNRPISDPSAGGRGSNSHHSGRRCRFGAGRNNNGSGVGGGGGSGTRDPNYWRNRNKMQFEMNAERRDERPPAEEIEICSMAAPRPPIADRKETMETSVDV
jgi:hypothetical protein